MSSSTDVGIRLTHSVDEDGEYGAFTSVAVDILSGTRKIGSIAATIVDRQKIPLNSFMSAMDGYSSDLQWVGTSLFEPVRGRTRLRSLAEYDDDEFDFMYVQSLNVDDEFKANGASDVGAAALRQFLHHPFVKGNSQFGCWRVSSAVYVLDPREAMTSQERDAHRSRARERSLAAMMSGPQDTEETRREDRRLDALARADANQFLRCGFFQDPAIARAGDTSARFLVASYGDWTRPMKTHAEAAAVRFYVPPPMPPPPAGADAEIFELATRTCALAVAYGGEVRPAEAARFRSEVWRLVSSGGSVSGSQALHAACANNALAVVDCLLEIDPACVNARDRGNLTPLMIAAVNAAGRRTIRGIQDTRVIDRLLAAAALKDMQDHFGLTAYGHFEKQKAGYDTMMLAMMGLPTGGQQPAPWSVQALEAKLLPQGGATASDLTGGEGADYGFVNYSSGDEEEDFGSDEEGTGDY